MAIPELGEFAHVVEESSIELKIPAEFQGPGGVNTDKFIEAAVAGEKLILLWTEGVTLHDIETGEVSSRWTEMGIGLDFGDCSPLGILLLTQADRRDAPDGSAQQVTFLHPETLAPLFSNPATSFVHERLPGDAPLSFERAYLANDGIIWALSHEFKSGADRSVLYEITREGKCLQVYVLSEPIPQLRQVRAVDHVGERQRKIALSQLTCSADRRWVHLIGKFDLWEIDIHTGKGAHDNPAPLQPILKLTTFVRDMKMERIFWDIQNRFLLVTPDQGKEFVIFHYHPDPKADEHSLQIAKIGVYCGEFQSQDAGLYVWEKGKAKPLLYREKKLDRTQMFSCGTGRYLIIGDFGEEIPLIIFDTYNWKSVQITEGDHPEMIPVGLTAADEVWGLDGAKLLKVRIEKGMAPKKKNWAAIFLFLLLGAAAIGGALYYFMIYKQGG